MEKVARNVEEDGPVWERRKNKSCGLVSAKNAQLFLSPGHAVWKILQRAFIRKEVNVPCTRRYRELDDAMVAE